MEKTAKSKKLTGVVVSDRMQKTAVVEITRLKKHSRYLKYLTLTQRIKAHNEGNEYKIGDVVVLRESQPLSKEKRWIIVGRVEKPGTA